MHIMNLKQYINTHIRRDPDTKKERIYGEYLIERAKFVAEIGVTSAYLCQLVKGNIGPRKIQPSPELAQRINKATGGRVELWALLPKVYPKPPKIPADKVDV